ncbi:MAG: J domain-containing protein [Thermostichales cyanobacterium SRBZ-1_bins_19]
MQNFKDYYKILGVSKGADANEIKRAFRKLARQYHPDVNPGNKAAEEKFKDINEAYEVLSDPAKRQQYDQFGQFYQQTGFRPPTGSPFEADFNPTMDFTPFQDFQEFIDQLLGRAGSPGGFRSSSGSSYSQGNYDAEATIYLTLPEAYQGGRRKVRLESGKALDVMIPPGITPGKKIRLRGQGQPKPSGDAGDLYLKVQLKEHPLFKLEGADVLCTIPISPSEAVLGGEITVPTLEGKVTVRVPAGVRPGQKLRLSGKGFPKGDGERGDQLISLQVVVPEKVTERERELYAELQRIQSYDPRSNLMQSV